MQAPTICTSILFAISEAKAAAAPAHLLCELRSRRRAGDIDRPQSAVAGATNAAVAAVDVDVAVIVGVVVHVVAVVVVLGMADDVVVFVVAQPHRCQNMWVIVQLKRARKLKAILGAISRHLQVNLRE